MPRKKNSLKGNSMEVKLREFTRERYTHESMVDYLHGKPPFGSFLNVFAPNFFGLNFARPYEDDVINLHDAVDWIPPYVTHRPHSPNMQIRELTDEEVEDFLKREREEDQRRIKTERNKRKKMRKKEKKRLEKENAENDKSEDEADDDEEEEEEEEEKEEVEKSVSTAKFSEARLKNPTIDKKAKANDANAPPNSNNCCTFQNKTMPPGRNERGGNNEKSKAVENNKEEHMEKMESELKIPCEAIFAKSVPVAKCKQKPFKEKENKISEWIQVPKKEKKTDMIAPIQVPKKEKKTAITPIDVPKKEKKTEAIHSIKTRNDKENLKISEEPGIYKDESPTVIIEKSAHPSAGEFARRSMELGGLGNRLAASGQFEMAVKYFTDAIKFNPTEYKLFGNRSLCYERLQQYKKALSDADLALSMQPNWIKGLFRKGKALCGLQRYYEASMVYRKVLELESTSVEAAQELKRAQILHLMEMGFSQSESSDALEAHPSLEDAMEALFVGEIITQPLQNYTAADHQALQGEDEDGEWTVQSNRSRAQHNKEFNGSGEIRTKSQLMARPRSSVKSELFPIWVGSLRPSMTYMRLHELFSRAGKVYSIKMLLDQDCAFVNFTRKEDCDQAIKCLNGMIVDGVPLTVRYPLRVHTQLGAAKSACTDPRVGQECFFWRTTGCIKSDCTFQHIPAHKNMDRERFTSHLGNVGNPK